MDVLLHPLQGKPHIVDGCVGHAIVSHVARGQEPERAQAVLYTNDDVRVVVRRQLLPEIVFPNAAFSISTTVFTPKQPRSAAYMRAIAVI